MLDEYTCAPGRGLGRKNTFPPFTFYTDVTDMSVARQCARKPGNTRFFHSFLSGVPAEARILLADCVVQTSQDKVL